MLKIILPVFISTVLLHTAASHGAAHPFRLEAVACATLNTTATPEIAAFVEQIEAITAAARIERHKALGKMHTYKNIKIPTCTLCEKPCIPCLYGDCSTIIPMTHSMNGWQPSKSTGHHCRKQHPDVYTCARMQCPFCDKSFRRIYHLNRHIFESNEPINNHTEEANHIIEKKWEKTESQTCPDCTATLKNKRRITRSAAATYPSNTI